MEWISGLSIYEDIENIIEDVKLEATSQGFDVLRDMKVSGNNLMVTCPVHSNGQESKPSCGITLTQIKSGNRTIDAGTANCFTCGYTAGLPLFISNVFGKEDGGKLGYKWLSRQYVNIEVEQREPIVFNFETDKKEEVIEYVDPQELQKYNYIHEYMYERKLTDYVVSYFNVGYDPQDYALTFPIKNKEGNILFIQRRYVPYEPNGYKRFHNDSGKSKKTCYGLYEVWNNLELLKQVGKLYVVESPIDALTMWTWGLPCIGTLQAIPTGEQLKLIDELPVNELVSAHDNDEAGVRGANRLRQKSTKLVKRYLFPNGYKDINEMDYNTFNSGRETLVF